MFIYSSLCLPGMTLKLTAWAAGQISHELRIACGPLILNTANVSRGEKPAVMPVKVNNATVNRGHHTS